MLLIRVQKKLSILGRVEDIALSMSTVLNFCCKIRGSLKKNIMLFIVWIYSGVKSSKIDPITILKSITRIGKDFLFSVRLRIKASTTKQIACLINLVV